MSNEMNRRDFLGWSFGAVAAVGAGASLVAMKQSWDPLPSVLSAGFTKVDLTTAEPGNPSLVTWRGKPIFVLRKTKEMEESDRDIVANGERYIVVIGLCTHLGCIPAWKKDVWKCACHGGEFDSNGTQTFGPPPRPLDIPPFSISGTTLTLGEEGPEYQKILADSATA